MIGDIYLQTFLEGASVFRIKLYKIIIEKQLQVIDTTLAINSYPDN